MFIIRAGLQILADHPRLYLNAGSKPDTEWLRLRGPVPPDRRDCNDADAVWTAKEDSVALPKHLGLPGFRHSIGLARWWHFAFDLLWLVNGLVFYILLFSTGEWKRLVPNPFDVFPNALSTALQYLSLELPETATAVASGKFGSIVITRRAVNTVACSVVMMATFRSNWSDRQNRQTGDTAVVGDYCPRCTVPSSDVMHDITRP